MTAVKNDFGGIDLEERKVVYQLMQRLTKEALISWLVWCAAVASKNGLHVIVTDSSGEPHQVYDDWVMLCSQYGLDWRLSRGNLELRARQDGTPLFWATGHQQKKG